MSRLDIQPVGPARLAAQVAAADRVARVLVGGFDLCADGGRPLSALQRVELIKAALLEFDRLDADVGANLEVERRLRDVRNGSRA
jgi:hypothetical protein